MQLRQFASVPKEHTQKNNHVVKSLGYQLLAATGITWDPHINTLALAVAK